MAIDSEHPEYEARKIEWKKLRDCSAGQEIIHSEGTKYLPRLSEQEDADYQAYKQRATFYGATARTIDGLSGMVFRKEPQVDLPGSIAPFVNDITLDGTTLLGFAEQIIDDDITVGRAGILVDHPVVSDNMTVADAETMNMRPFLKHYRAENIFNWKVGSRNNAQVLTEVRLWETVELPGDEEFEVTEQRQIRILDFDEENRYRQRVFVKVKGADGKEKWEQLGEDIFPLRDGSALDVIPFFFVGVKNGTPTVEKPPLIDLAHINISHYQSTADLEHGAHYTGLPTAYITGHTPEKGEGDFTIGSRAAWVFPDPETKIGFLEFLGQGLEALEKRIAKKEEQMAFLGARMLTPEKRAAEAAETAHIHRSGETSVLSSLAKSAAESIERALQFMADWVGSGGEVSFKLNNDFLAIPMSAQQLTALLQTWQSGGMAYADFLDNLKRGEIIREERTEDEIRSEIETINPFEGEDFESGE